MEIKKTNWSCYQSKGDSSLLHCASSTAHKNLVIRRIVSTARYCFSINEPCKVLLWKPLLPATEKCTVEWGVWKIASRGISGVSLARHFLKQERWAIFFNCIFRNRPWQGKFQERWSNFFFFWGITLLGQNGKILTTVNIDYSQSDYSVRLLSILSKLGSYREC